MKDESLQTERQGERSESPAPETKPRCPICGSSATSDWDRDCGTFFTCDSCGHRWSYQQSPAPTHEWVPTESGRASAMCAVDGCLLHRDAHPPRSVHTEAPQERKREIFDPGFAKGVSDPEWVTFGKIKTDAENETQTFERISPPVPMVACPTCEGCGQVQTDDPILAVRVPAAQAVDRAAVIRECATKCAEVVSEAERTLATLYFDEARLTQTAMKNGAIKCNLAIESLLSTPPAAKENKDGN